MFSGSVQHDSIRNNFMVELENLLGGRFGEFSTLDNFNKASFILGFENWNRDDFKALLKLVKSFVLPGIRLSPSGFARVSQSK